MIHYRYVFFGFLLVPWLFLSACSSFGPKRVALDRFDYNEAIAHSTNEQMLINLVRLRYSEVPVFLALNSVVTQYFYTGSIGVGGSAGASSGDPAWSVGGDIRALYAERPTITYNPLRGDEFARQLLAPLTSEMVFSLVQSGWPADQLLIMSLERMNHVENIPFAPFPSPEVMKRFREFRRVVDLIIKLAERRAIEMQSKNAENGGKRHLVFEEGQAPETQALIDELKRLLGLDPQYSEFRVTERLTRRKADEITVRVRSVLTMMGFLSRGVVVPPKHLEQKRALKLAYPEDEEARSLMVPLWIRSSADRPSDAYVTVRSEGYWFFIPHSDHASKRAFGLVTYLFRLQAPAAPAQAPVLTIPTG